MKKIVLSLTIVAALGACSRADGTPGEAVQAFFERGSMGKCAGLRELFATPKKGETAGTDEVSQIEQQCTKGVQRLKSIPDDQRDELLLKQATVLDTREEGDRAIVKLELENRAGDKSPPQLVAMVRQDGRWRIDLPTTNMLGMVPPDPMPTPSQLDNMRMMPPGLEMMPPQAPPPEMAPPATPPTQPTPAPRNQPPN